MTSKLKTSALQNMRTSREESGKGDGERGEYEEGMERITGGNGRRGDGAGKDGKMKGKA